MDRIVFYKTMLWGVSSAVLFSCCIMGLSALEMYKRGSIIYFGWMLSISLIVILILVSLFDMIRHTPFSFYGILLLGSLIPLIVLISALATGLIFQHRNELLEVDFYGMEIQTDKKAYDELMRIMNKGILSDKEMKQLLSDKNSPEQIERYLDNRIEESLDMIIPWKRSIPPERWERQTFIGFYITGLLCFLSSIWLHIITKKKERMWDCILKNHKQKMANN